MSFPREFIALDFETTGVVAARDEIIEIGAIRFRDGVETDIFEALICPERHLPIFIVEKTGITSEMLEKAPALDAIRNPFLAFLGSLPIVAHQARFELGFLREAFGFVPPEIFDTMKLAHDAGFQGRSLVKVATALGIESPAWHRAVPDARVTGKIFIALANRPEISSERTPRSVGLSRIAEHSTVDETLLLLSGGRTPEEAARLRNLGIGSIEKHVESLIMARRVSLENMLSNEEIIAACVVWDEVGWTSQLSTAFKTGRGRISYRALRWVRAARTRGGETKA